MTGNNQRIRILIADDNREFGDILSTFFSMYDDLEVCGIAKNGMEAVEMAHKTEPDIMLLDIIMPEYDGLEVLSKLRAKPPTKFPKIIVISAIGQEKIAHETFSKGASYYIIKPFKLEVLLERIRFIGKNDFPLHMLLAENTDNSSQNTINTIKKCIIETGIPTNILGYKYIVEALNLIITNEGEILLSKEIYFKLTEKFATTLACVERAIRYAIANAAKKKTPLYIHIFTGNKQEHNADNTGQEKLVISNSQFLSKVAEYIKLN